MRTLDKILTQIEDIVTVICFTFMSLVTLTGVFFRYCLGNPIIWSEEVSRYLMVWGIFIGISIATRKKAQLGIDIFVTMVPVKQRKILTFISHIFLILTYAVMFYLASVFVINASKTGQLTPILRLQFYYVYMAMPIGFFLSLIRAIQLFWREFISKTEPIDTPLNKDEEVFL